VLLRKIKMSKHVCPKCHKYKKKSMYARHVKRCIPSAEDVRYLSITKSGSFSKAKAAEK
jgi:hypothetical protein